MKSCGVHNDPLEPGQELQLDRHIQLVQPSDTPQQTSKSKMAALHIRVDVVLRSSYSSKNSRTVAHSDSDFTKSQVKVYNSSKSTLWAQEGLGEGKDGDLRTFCSVLTIYVCMSVM